MNQGKEYLESNPQIQILQKGWESKNTTQRSGAQRLAN